MPNGHGNDPGYDKVIADLDAFFAPASDLLISFARQHNLFLEKHYHDAPVWSLCFTQPLGGSAKVDVRREGNLLSISGVWWVDDYDAGTRSMKDIEAVKCEPDGEELAAVMAKTLSELMSLTSGNWSRVATGYKRGWHKTWTKEQFQKLSEPWPRPRL